MTTSSSGSGRGEQRATPAVGRMFRGCLAGCTILLMLPATPTSAEDWMFRRSYFSHAPATNANPLLAVGPGGAFAAATAYPVPESRSAYRVAYYREAFGYSVRSAFRWNNFVIQNGNRTDRTLYLEGYIEFDP